MEINKKIKETLKSNNIPIEDGICYLIALHHGYEPSYIPDDLKLKINFSKIVMPSKDKTGLSWSVPLYSNGETAFDWVKTEYIPLFKEKNKDKGGHARESTARMKKLFSDNPEIRKNDVILATRYYLNNTDPDFIRYPHYFISKGRGVEQISDLITWLERLKESEENTEGRSSVQTTMQ